MNKTHLIRIPLLIMVVCLTIDALDARVDPAWLRSWNEALRQRPAVLDSVARIAPEEEPGIGMIISGQVLNPDGTTADGVIVHASHRDQHGLDFGPRDESVTTWRLQGWARTDADGRFEFRSIRPAADHLGREPAHIHFTLESAKFGRQWMPSIFLADDPLATAEMRRTFDQTSRWAEVMAVPGDEALQLIEVTLQLGRTPDF